MYRIISYAAAALLTAGLGAAPAFAGNAADFYTERCWAYGEEERL